MELKDVLSDSPKIVLSQDATAMDVLTAMYQNDVDAVLVDRLDLEDAFGVVTAWDILSKVIAKGLEPEDVKITDICSKPLIVVNNLDLDIRWVAKKMANEEVCNVAVFDGEELTCLVSDTDILKAMDKDLRENPPKKSTKSRPRRGKRK